MLTAKLNESIDDKVLKDISDDPEVLSQHFEVPLDVLQYSDAICTVNIRSSKLFTNMLKEYAAKIYPEGFTISSAYTFVCVPININLHKFVSSFLDGTATVKEVFTRLKDYSKEERENDLLVELKMLHGVLLSGSSIPLSVCEQCVRQVELVFNMQKYQATVTAVLNVRQRLLLQGSFEVMTFLSDMVSYKWCTQRMIVLCSIRIQD